jgi:hypothetical protein
MKFESLIRTLEQLKWRYYVLLNQQGGNVVVLERGARVIGVFTDKHAGNHLWVNPNLQLWAQEQTNLGSVSEEGWNSGGDRMWLSPEIEFNVRNRHAFWDSYKIQEVIDPGTYCGEFDPLLQVVDLKQRALVNAYHSGLQAQVQISKVIRNASDPFQANGYRFAGYDVNETLILDEEAVDMPIALWNIAQLPAGGEIVIPTRGRADADHFFAPAGKSHLQIGERDIRFRVDAASQHKISIKASFVTGKAAYIRHYDNGFASLLIRSFEVQPSREYRDFPVHDPEARGHCVQCYNDSGDLGQFGELEYHTPVIDYAQGQRQIQDYSQVWCYDGEAAIISEIQEALLYD